jgi:hypothetical protein
MTRALIVGFAVLLAAIVGSAYPALPQVGYDRPGADYANASVLGGDPAVCAARCERDKNCKSWSFSYPASGTQATCYLKRAVVPPVASSCCVSGVRGAGVIEPQNGSTEYSIDRYGGDYRSFETPADPTGKACADACQGENKCRAWTYRRPGYGTPTARCYLKDAIKPPRRRPCCVSGVVR